MYLIDYVTFKRRSAFFMLSPCRAIYNFIRILLVLIGIFCVWAYFAPFDEVVKATAQLRPTKAVSTIRCTTSGEIVSRTYVNNGAVAQNQLLFALDTSAKEKELESDRQQLQQNADDIAVQQVLLQVIKTNTLPDIPENTAAYATAAAYIYKRWHYESLVSESFSKLQIEKNMPKGLYVPQNVIDCQLAYDQQVLAYETWKSSFYTQALENYSQLETKEKALLSAISELERNIKNAKIYAPISGIVTEVAKVNIGDYIISGEEILTITPVNETSLQADVYIDPSAAAKIQVTNPVYIKFPGLPPSKYGIVQTYISSVPPDITLLSTGTQAFVAEAPLLHNILTARNGETVHLVPGLTAEVRIVVGHTTMHQFLLTKLDFVF